jgi:dihydroxyacetone kinase, phosphotransfer subunit
MVGLVIVTQSQKLAEGIQETAGSLAGGSVKIVAAGGTKNGGFGTDIIRILEAILTADSGDGAVIITDLESSLINCRAAVELLDDDTRQAVKIADAPVFEGAAGAAVEASLGSPVEEVAAAAEEAALQQKFI